MKIHSRWADCLIVRSGACALPTLISSPILLIGDWLYSLVCERSWSRGRRKQMLRFSSDKAPFAYDEARSGGESTPGMPTDRATPRSVRDTQNPKPEERRPKETRRPRSES